MKHLHLIALLLSFQLASATTLTWTVTRPGTYPKAFPPQVSPPSLQIGPNDGITNSVMMPKIIDLAKQYLQAHPNDTVVLQFPAGGFYFKPTPDDINARNYSAIRIAGSIYGNLKLLGAAPPRRYAFTLPAPTEDFNIRYHLASIGGLGETRIVNTDLTDRGGDNIYELGSGISIVDSNNVEFQNFHVTRVSEFQRAPFDSEMSGTPAVINRHVKLNATQVVEKSICTTQGTVVSYPAQVQPVDGRVKLRIRIDKSFPDPRWITQLASGDREQSLLAFFDNYERPPGSLQPEATPAFPQLSPRSAKMQLSQSPGDEIRYVGFFTDSYGSGREYEFTLQEPIDTLTSVVPGTRVAFKSKCGVQTVRIENSDNCKLTDVRLTRSFAAPVVAESVGSLVLTRVTIDRPDELIESKAPFLSGPGGGIQVKNKRQGCVLSGCTVIGTADAGIGIFSDKEQLLEAEGILIENCLVADNQSRGVLLTQSDGRVNRNFMRGNLLIRNGSSPIAIRNGSSSAKAGRSVKAWTISGNVILQPGGDSAISFTDEYVAGIEQEAHDDIRIENNHFIEASWCNNLIYITNTLRVFFDGNVIESVTPSDWIEFSRTTTSKNSALIYVQGAVTNIAGQKTAITSASPNILNTPLGAGRLLRSGAGADSINAEWSVMLPPEPLCEGTVSATNTWDSHGIANDNLIRVGNTAEGNPLIGLVGFVSPGYVPNAAQITSAKLYLSVGGAGNRSELDSLGQLLVQADNSGKVGTDASLQPSDFNPPSLLLNWAIKSASDLEIGNTLEIPIALPVANYISKSNNTQLRLTFSLNSGKSRYMGFLSSATDQMSIPGLEVRFR